jgi:hypothetical protein
MYEDLELYGRVEYFLVHTYRDVQRMLAFVQWTTNLRIDNFEIKTFYGYSSYSYIDVEYIDRCVGFMRIENTFYILDKENQVVYE